MGLRSSRALGPRPRGLARGPGICLFFSTSLASSETRQAGETLAEPRFTSPLLPAGHEHRSPRALPGRRPRPGRPCRPQPRRSARHHRSGTAQRAGEARSRSDPAPRPPAPAPAASRALPLRPRPGPRWPRSPAQPSRPLRPAAHGAARSGRGSGGSPATPPCGGRSGAPARLRSALH